MIIFIKEYIYMAYVLTNIYILLYVILIIIYKIYKSYYDNIIEVADGLNERNEIFI